MPVGRRPWGAHCLRVEILGQGGVRRQLVAIQRAAQHQVAASPVKGGTIVRVEPPAPEGPSQPVANQQRGETSVRADWLLQVAIWQLEVHSRPVVPPREEHQQRAGLQREEHLRLVVPQREEFLRLVVPQQGEHLHRAEV